jgi:FixJ family two-component response regulator
VPENRFQAVFVVDDEPVIASTVAAILNASGFRATPFTSPEDAIRAAQRECPALMVSDVVMPGVNGIDLAIHLRSLCPKCKVLLFSGQAATRELIDLAKNAGHDFELLAKPVHPKDLLAALRRT